DAKREVITLGDQIGLSVPTVKSMLLKIDAGQIDDVERQLNIMARNRTMNLSIIASGAPGYGTGPRDRGGLVGPGGALAAERRPEFVRLPGGEQGLLVAPALVPPGTQVTSGAETGRILASP